MTLEQTIADLVARKYAAPEGSAEYRMAERQLNGLRLTDMDAGPIIEEYDWYDWAPTHVRIPPDRQ